MVARKANAEVRSDNLAMQAFNGWRRALWHAHKGAQNGAQTLASDVGELAHGSASPLTRKGLLFAGVACMILGAALRALYPPGPVTTEAALTGAGVAGWALVRLLALMLLAGQSPRSRAAIRAAWGIGLLPLAASLNGWLAAGVWVVSGVATATVLGRFLDKSRSGRLVVAAWSIQLALQIVVIAFNWLAMYLLVALFA